MTEYKTNTKERAIVHRVTDGIIWARVAGHYGHLPFDEAEGYCLLKSKQHLKLVFPKKKKVVENTLSTLAFEAQCDCI